MWIVFFLRSWSNIFVIGKRSFRKCPLFFYIPNYKLNILYSEFGQRGEFGYMIHHSSTQSPLSSNSFDIVTFCNVKTTWSNHISLWWITWEVNGVVLVRIRSYCTPWKRRNSVRKNLKKKQDWQRKNRHRSTISINLHNVKSEEKTLKTIFDCASKHLE